MKSKRLQIAVLSLALSTFSMQMAKADCFNAYTAKINQIGNIQIPEVHKQTVFKSILEHVGATVGVLPGSGGIAFMVALGGGCLDLGFSKAPVCNALAILSVVALEGVANGIIYKEFDKTDSSGHDGALSTKKTDLNEYQAPFLAVSELHYGQTNVNTKKISEEVLALTPSAAKLTDAQFVQIFSMLNTNNDFCQNDVPENQSDMIRDLKKAIENFQLKNQ